MDEGLYTGAVFIDLKKAFDTVDVKILVQKLAKIGVSEDVLRWFESYLFNRSICTCIESVTSNVSSIEYGIPQGSTLGPILFTLYINDIVKHVKYCKLHLYADDTVIYLSGKNISDIENAYNI